MWKTYTRYRKILFISSDKGETWHVGTVIHKEEDSIRVYPQSVLLDLYKSDIGIDITKLIVSDIEYKDCDPWVPPKPPSVEPRWPWYVTMGVTILLLFLALFILFN